jgi:uncharacterized RDD family membrane protein YckC
MMEEAAQEPTPLPYSSIGRRFLALLLDWVILLVPGAIMAHVLPVLGGLVVWFFYAPMLESSRLQATLGKKIMGLQVVGPGGVRASFQAALIRNFVKIISALLLFLGFVLAIFSDRKQALHDLIANTFVIDGESHAPVVDSWVENVKNVFHSAGIKVGGDSSTASELERLQALRDRGVLTEEEFQAAKRRVLSRA